MVSGSSCRRLQGKQRLRPLPQKCAPGRRRRRRRRWPGCRPRRYRAASAQTIGPLCTPKRLGACLLEDGGGGVPVGDALPRASEREPVPVPIEQPVEDSRWNGAVSERERRVPVPYVLSTPASRREDGVVQRMQRAPREYERHKHSETMQRTCGRPLERWLDYL